MSQYIFPHPQTGLNFSTKVRKYTFDVIVWYKLTFGMLDTFQIVTPFIPLRSHNVAQNSDPVAFHLVCCYNI
jgi:hypothetical protein